VENAISFVGAEHSFFTEAKARRILDISRRRLGPLDRIRALDVGSGIGLTDAYLEEIGSLEGVDISDEVVCLARNANPGVRYQAYDGERLPFSDGAFDLAFAVCVLHHVPAENWAGFASELGRCVRTGGLVAIFEHNPFNPLTRLAVHRCSFDEDVELLSSGRTARLLRGAGLQPVEARYILFFPWRSNALAAFERRLGRVPLGAQYYVVAQKLAS
jgi:SAM-dependent methyltransferase